MTMLRAQAAWCERSIAERLALLAPWVSEQSLSLRGALCLLQGQAQAAEQRSISDLADGRQLHSGYGPLGLVALSSASALDSAAGAAHLVWAAVLGNAVHYCSDDAAVQNEVSSLQNILFAHDPALKGLLQVSTQAPVEKHSCVVLSRAELHVVLAPSTEPGALVDELNEACPEHSIVLWVNHALQVEIQLRLPGIKLLEGTEALQWSARNSGLALVACGSVADTLHMLQSDSRRRTALYSGDWREVHESCAQACARGVLFAVNTCSGPVLGLNEARALYQRPAQVVISRGN